MSENFDTGVCKTFLPLFNLLGFFFEEKTVLLNPAFYVRPDSLLRPGAGLGADPAHCVAAAVDVAVD